MTNAADVAAERIRQQAAQGNALSRDAQISARAHEILREKRQAELEALKARTLAMVNVGKSPERSPVSGQFRRPENLVSKLAESGIDPRPFIASGGTHAAVRASMEATLLAHQAAQRSDSNETTA